MIIEEMEERNLCAKVLLATVLFKEDREDIINDFWYFSGKDVSPWRFEAPRVIYRFKNKACDLNLSVEEFRSFVRELLDSGYKFSVDAFGKNCLKG